MLETHFKKNYTKVLLRKELQDRENLNRTIGACNSITFIVTMFIDSFQVIIGFYRVKWNYVQSSVNPSIAFSGQLTCWQQSTLLGSHYKALFINCLRHDSVNIWSTFKTVSVKLVINSLPSICWCYCCIVFFIGGGSVRLNSFPFVFCLFCVFMNWRKTFWTLIGSSNLLVTTKPFRSHQDKNIHIYTSPCNRSCVKVILLGNETQITDYVRRPMNNRVWWKDARNEVQ